MIDIVITSWELCVTTARGFAGLAAIKMPV